MRIPTPFRYITMNSLSRITQALRRKRFAKPHPQFIKRLSSWLVLSTTLTVATSLIPEGNAGTYTWNQTAAGTTYSWGLGTNWTPAGFPDFVDDVANLNNDILGAQTVNLNGVISVGTLNIGDASGTSAFTLAGGTGGYLFFDVSSGSAAINKTTGGNDTISAGVQFRDTLAITNTSSGSLTLSGGLRSFTSGITFNGSGAITVSTSGIVAAGGITKNDAGTTTLSIASTFAGPTTVNGGTLAVTVASGLPARSAVTVAAGATLDFRDTSNSIGSLSGAGDVRASTATVVRTMTIGADNTSTTFSGRFVAPTNATFMAITKVGSGTLTLAPTAASTYTGTTSINGGGLILDFSASSLSSMLASTPLTLGGGTLTVKGRNSGPAISQGLGAFTISAGGGSIVMDPNGSALGTTLTLGAITSTAGGAVLITAPANTSVIFNQNLNGGTNINGRLVFTANGTNFDWAANGGANTATVGLGTYNDVAGTTLAATDSLNDRISSSVVGQTTSVNAAGSVTNSLKIIADASGQSLALGTSSLTLTSGGLLFTGAEDYTISGSTGTLKSGTATNSDLIVHHYGTGNLTIGAVIGNGAGASTLTKDGTGKLTLTGTNTYTGITYIDGGILSISSNANLGAVATGAAINIADGGTLQNTAAALTLDNATANKRNVVLLGGNATIDPGAGNTLTISGVVSGAGNLVTAANSGILILSGTNTYTGSTTIGAGSTVRAGIASAAFGVNSPVTINAGGTLDLAGFDESIGSLSGSGTFTNSGAAKTLTVGGDNTSTTFSGNFTGPASALVKTGSGVLTLASSATSTWTGSGSAITGGVIRLGANNVLPASGTWTLANNANGNPVMLDLNDFSTSIGTVTIYGTTSIASSQALINLGTGTLTLAGNVTVNNTNNPQAAVITGTGTGGIAMTAVRTFDVRDSTAVLANEAELTINGNISGVGGGITKNGSGNLRISGGTNTTTATNTFNSGTTFLDFVADNTAKLGTGALVMAGGNLVLLGNSSADTLQSVPSFSLTGSSTISLVAGAGHGVALDLGAITRSTSGGVIRFYLPSGVQSDSNGVLTSTANGATGIIGGYAIVNDGTVSSFATNSGGNLMAVETTLQDAVNAWLTGQHISDVTGFTGTLDSETSIGSLRFNSAGPSSIAIAAGGVLNIASGGILQTSNAAAGISSITGGRLSSGASNELIFTIEGALRFDVGSSITGAGAVTKAANGTLRLTGTNNYSGATALLGGTLQVSGGNAIGDNSALTMSATQSSVFELLSDETIGSLATGGINSGGIVSEIRLGANTLTLNQTTNADYSGIVTGSGNIIRNGTSGVGNLRFFSTLPTTFTGTLTVNGGLFYLDGSGSLGNASAITLNKGSSLLLSNSGTTRLATRILDTTPITLNSADGAWNGETKPSGLSIRTDQAATTNETIGVLSFNSGASYMRSDITGGNATTSGLADIIADNFVRNNNATVDARGVAMGSATGNSRAHFRIGTSANETAFIGTLVGGPGAAGSKNIAIVPWAFGETLTTTLADNNMGNSLVTYVAANGFRALDFATEYNTYAASAVATENIRESLTADLTGLTGKTINALVLNNNNTAASVLNFTGTGALAVTAGTMLFTANTAAAASAAMGFNVGGFSGITVGGTNEYIFLVQNPSSVATTATMTATINAPLTSTADITKSGRGTLILAVANTAGGGTRKTTLNEGVLQIDALNKIGGDTGNVVFAGGTLKFGGVFDLTTRNISFLLGGGVIDTNGNNITFANSFGSGAGGLTKTGAGDLTLGGTAGYTGRTTVGAGRLVLKGGTNRLSTTAG